MGVRGYLASRCLLDLAIDDRWLALDLTELRLRIEERAALGGNPTEGDLGRAGLVTLRDDGYAPAWPQHRLVIPWRTPRGEIDLVQRRVLEGSPRSKYIFPSGAGPAWPHGIERLAGAPKDAELVIVEGALDALARRALDDRGCVVLGLPGANGWRPTWAQLARDRVVRLALDADEAGDRASDAMSAGLFAAGALRVIRERPRGGDWAEQWAQQCASRAA